MGESGGGSSSGSGTGRPRIVPHPDADQVRRFVFEHLPVRGQLVDLSAAWQAALATRPYPAPVRDVLGQAMGAVALLASSLKFDGRMTLQVTGDGPLRMMVVQCRSELTLRAMAHAEDGADEAVDFHDLVRDGRLVLSIEASDGQRYQGIVALERPTFVACLENYFANSEQLPTRLWLHCDGERVAGLLLQKMPLPESASDADAAEAGTQWQRLQRLVDEAPAARRHHPSDVDLLRGVFPNDDVRLFEPSAASSHCGCSRERIERVLLMMGRDEVRSSMGDAGGLLTVSCEFCGQGFTFDETDAEAIFRREDGGNGSGNGAPDHVTLH